MPSAQAPCCPKKKTSDLYITTITFFCSICSQGLQLSGSMETRVAGSPPKPLRICFGSSAHGVFEAYIHHIDGPFWGSRQLVKTSFATKYRNGLEAIEQEKREKKNETHTPLLLEVVIRKFSAFHVQSVFFLY